jgi:hypothetical protein
VAERGRVGANRTPRRDVVTSPTQWLTVDEGWGRKAVDFPTLSEPASCRDYPTRADVSRLRDAGLDEDQIFAVTLFLE